MTVSLCIRQESKRNNDSVSVEELDWSAERQVLILTKHLWCDFKWDKNSSPNTNDLYIHYMDSSLIIIANVLTPQPAEQFCLYCSNTYGGDSIYT